MSDLKEGAVRVAKTLREAGHQAYFAGGCVRDGLLGNPPKDYDIVTSARPNEVTKLFRRTIQVGASFGVVKVLLGKGREYEVATFRKDGSYSDGRRPDQVVYSDSAEEDVKRRDFTINALLEDPETGEVIDHVGGKADLAQKLIRAVGDPALRVAEDRLRMLRAVRFAARFSFDIEAATIEAIVEHASEIVDVSAERITKELEGIWSSANPGLGMQLLERTGLRPYVLPTIVEGRVDALARLPGLARDAETTRRIAWATLFAGLDRKQSEAEMRRLKMSREQIRVVQTLDEAYSLLCDPAASEPAESRRLLVSEEADLYVDFQKVLFGDGAPVQALGEVHAELAAEPLPKLPLVTGGDLMNLGMKPGPRFKEILDRVTLAVLRREIQTKEEGLALAKTLTDQ